MNRLELKNTNQQLRKARVRSKVHGTAECPRLSVVISNRHVSAQLVDDDTMKTIASATSVGTKLTGTMTELASHVGSDIAKKALKIKVKKAVFDRNGHRYAKRLSALADAARKEGLEF